MFCACMFPLPLPSLRSSGANWCLPLIPLGDCCHGYIGARRELVQNPLPFCPPMLPRDWQARLRSSMNDPGLPVLAPCHSKMKSAGTPRIFTFSCPHPCSILTEQIPAGRDESQNDSKPTSAVPFALQGKGGWWPLEHPFCGWETGPPFARHPSWNRGSAEMLPCCILLASSYVPFSPCRESYLLTKRLVVTRST